MTEKRYNAIHWGIMHCRALRVFFFSVQTGNIKKKMVLKRKGSVMFNSGKGFCVKVVKLQQNMYNTNY